MKIEKASENPRSDRPRVFIIYSHDSEEWQLRVVRTLWDLERKGTIDIFDDTIIEPGEKWNERLREEILKSSIAVLIVDQNFFKSDFIMKVELPLIIEMSDAGKCTVLWIPVERTANEEGYEAVLRMQCFSDPNDPLSEMDYRAASLLLSALPERLLSSIASKR